MTLTAVATLTRRFIFLSVLFLIIGIASFIGYKIWYANYLSSIPLVEEQPDVRWGSLPEPDFPNVDVSSSNFSYSLDTTTGGLPSFEKLIKVYFIPKAYATFLAPDKSQDLTNQLGIDAPPIIISETKYSYIQDTKNLTIDLDTGNFSYKKEATTAGATEQTETTNTENLIIEFKNFLNSKQLLKDSLQNGPSKINQVTVAETPSFEISIWPANIDEKPILTSNPDKSLINATVINNARSIENYASLNYIFWPIDTSTFGTYPTKSVEKAFSDLKSGGGIIIQEPTSPQVSITSVYLAYFLSETYSPYLQPVYVFEGPNFRAYIEAIDDQFITNQTTEN